MDRSPDASSKKGPRAEAVEMDARKQGREIASTRKVVSSDRRCSMSNSTFGFPPRKTQDFVFVFLDAPFEWNTKLAYEMALKTLRNRHADSTIVCSRDIWQSAEARACGHNTLLGVTTHYYYLGCNGDDPVIKKALKFLRGLVPSPHIEKF
jgi:16S rRNA G966 N2-methylase RsmD